jgi:hypothetical protein
MRDNINIQEGEFMSQDLLDSLLADIPAEEVRDERIGTYDDAVLVKDVDIQVKDTEHGTQYALVAEFKVTNEAGDHKAVAYIGIPNKDSEGWRKNFLLRWLHAFALIPFTNKNTPVLPDGDEETRHQVAEKIASAFNTKVGESVAIVIQENKQGFVNINPGKAKFQKAA